ncbi:hypothetical protein [Actinoplanes xinjiangensis]|uniref:Uncharacterized protein n=1 Tax=Actinoplanes xinjiangensis TaxID=512350 RepID=A0A316F4M9_9ACTN|nr:hypothetical protein [Actinoplanes xinjiangensis]PWK40556.1 hypothetical protein BC793_119164 [Actinoplanes xinjiangensis]GIF42225.1 hypothetical protein Axi01nite_65360 [Actinoplanes xinjiangensis]
MDLLLEKLGEVGGLHFMDTGDVHSRDLSIAALVELTDRDPSSVTGLRTLCVVLQARPDATGEITDAEELIARARRLRALVPAGDDRWTAEWIIAGGLFARHRLRRDPAGLNEAITLYRRAAAQVSPADSRSAEILSMLIRALVARFDVLGASDDIHEATAVADRLDALPLASGSGGVLVNAANALSAAYERTADPGFAIRAAGLIRHGRDLMSPRDPQFCATSSALASALIDQAAVDPGDRPKLLAEAVTAARDATDLPAGHRDRAAYLAQYADMLLQASPEPAGHLDMAVTAAHAAVQEARTGTDTASALAVLARAL